MDEKLVLDSLRAELEAGHIKIEDLPQAWQDKLAE